MTRRSPRRREARRACTRWCLGAVVMGPMPTEGSSWALATTTKSPVIVGRGSAIALGRAPASSPVLL